MPAHWHLQHQVFLIDTPKSWKISVGASLYTKICADSWKTTPQLGLVREDSSNFDGGADRTQPDRFDASQSKGTGRSNFEITQLEILKAVAIVYPFAVTFNKDDLFNVGMDDAQWKEVNRFTTWVTLAPAERIAKHIDELRKGLETAAGIAQMNYSKGTKAYLTKTINLVGYGLINFLSEEERNKNGALFKLNLTTDKVRALWNLPESHLPKLFIKVIQPYVEYVNKIYLPRGGYPRIT